MVQLDFEGLLDLKYVFLFIEIPTFVVRYVLNCADFLLHINSYHQITVNYWKTDSNHRYVDVHA